MSAATAPELPEYAGISKSDCCVDCTPERCVITHANICGHPAKGGLQAAFQAQPAVLARYNKAKKHLLLEQARERAEKETAA